jgi:hypothetical protein
MSKYKDIDKIIKHVRQIETTCDEATIKQIVCILVSRLLNPLSVEETAGLMVGLAEAEQAALDELEIESNKDKNKLH